MCCETLCLLFPPQKTQGVLGPAKTRLLLGSPNPFWAGQVSFGETEAHIAKGPLCQSTFARPALKESVEFAEIKHTIRSIEQDSNIVKHSR